MHSLTPLLVLTVALAVSSSGCFLAVAGIVEASRKDPKPDPMGEEFTGRQGEIGWAEAAPNPEARTAELLQGMHRIGCTLDNPYIGGSFAHCPRRPHLALLHAGRHVYRMCAPKTDRMQCRMAWEAVHKRLPGFSDR